MDSKQSALLAWERDDIEQRWGFPGGRFTRVNLLFTGLIALAMTLAFYGALMACMHFDLPVLDRIGVSFTERGPIPYPTVFFTMWCVSILYVKWRKLAYQRKSLARQVVPSDHDFVLSPSTVDQVVDGIHEAVDDPRHFVLFNRIMVALSNLRNLGVVGDVDDILRSQGENDESGLETSYAMIGAFVWCIPVLGFIGTVQGLSDAIGNFGAVLQATGELAQIKAALQNVTAGLATAFETTFQALVFALLIQLALVYLKASEEDFLDACGDYCLKHIVNRLRMTPFQAEQLS
jgi:hypothetical protein